MISIYEDGTFQLRLHIVFNYNCIESVMLPYNYDQTSQQIDKAKDIYT